MVQIDPSKNDNYNINLTQDEQILADYIFQKLEGSTQTPISLKQLPRILDPTQLRINNIYFDPQFLNLLTAYAEQNSKLNVSFHQFNLIVSELKCSLSTGHITSSMPEPSILSNSITEDSPPTELKKRKSFLAARRRTNPFPFYSETTLFSAESLGQAEYLDDRISFQENSNEDSTCSFLPNSDPTLPPSRLPLKKKSQKFENSFSKRVSLGFEAYLNDVPTTTADKNVRRVASELSRKLACEKGLYSNMVQDAKNQILSLESNNIQLKEQIKDLSKTIWHLRESNKTQDEAFGTIEQDNISLLEKENNYKKDIKDLKRKLLEKTMSEKRAITELETAQSRATEADIQISKSYESQKRLKQDKAKLLQTIAKIKKESDRNLLESHNREQVLLEKIDSLKDQTLTTVSLEDSNLLSIDSSENLLPSSASDSLNNMLGNKVVHSNSQIFRKKIKPSTVTIKHNKKLRIQLEKIWALLEETKISLGDSQHANLQKTWEQLNEYKKETCLLLAQNAIQLPTNKLQLSDNQDINGEYPALSARRGFLNRVMRRRGSSARLSPKRLSLLLSQPRSNLHKVSSGRNSSQEEILSPMNDIASPLENNNELDCCLNSDDLVFNKKSFNASSGLIPPFHLEDKKTKRISKESITSSRSGSDFSKYNNSVRTNSPHFSEKNIDITDTDLNENDCEKGFKINSLDESVDLKYNNFDIENTSHLDKINPSALSRKIATRNIIDLNSTQNSDEYYGTIVINSEDSKIIDHSSNIIKATQNDDELNSSQSLKKPQAPLIHNSIHTRCQNCGYFLMLPHENIIKNPVINFSDLSYFPKKAAIVSGTFLEPNIIPEIINPSSSLKTAVYLARFMPKNNSSDITCLSKHPQHINSQNSVSANSTSLDAFSSDDFEIIDLKSERCAPCPANWTRDDDDFTFETSYFHKNMNPLPHPGLFLSRSGHCRVYQMGLL